jgi:nucleotide-binding universal stress UspA family protein
LKNAFARLLWLTIDPLKERIIEDQVKGENMAGRILLAVDESNNSLEAVKYVAQNIRRESEVTVLTILPDPTAACELEEPSLIPRFRESRQAFCAMEDAKRERMEGFVEKARAFLVQSGFPPEKVKTRIEKKRSDIAKDIVREANEGKYDTIVLGRRGLTGVQEFLFGSVSNKVLHIATGFAVTVVD